jgi:molybdenum cofactor guanylyltransferase
MKHKEVTGIILAGGESRRMGKDKGLCDFDGKPLVLHAIEILKPICEFIVISTNNVQDYSNFGCKIITDEFKGIGPIGGIYSGLKQSTTIHNLVISCDIPFLNSALLTNVLSFSISYDVIVPQHANSYYEPLAAYYSKKIIPVLQESISEGDFKLINLFGKVRFKAVQLEKNQNINHQFKNINFPEDLK